MVFIVAMVNMREEQMALDAPNPASAAKVAKLFSDNGWQVDSASRAGPFHPDFVVVRSSIRYAVELKSVGEGRPDRVLTSLSQAILQFPIP